MKAWRRTDNFEARAIIRRGAFFPLPPFLISLFRKLTYLLFKCEWVEYKQHKKHLCTVNTCYKQWRNETVWLRFHDSQYLLGESTVFATRRGPMYKRKNRLNAQTQHHGQSGRRISSTKIHDPGELSAKQCVCGCRTIQLPRSSSNFQTVSTDIWHSILVHLL